MVLNIGVILILIDLESDTFNFIDEWQRTGFKKMSKY